MPVTPEWFVASQEMQQTELYPDDGSLVHEKGSELNGVANPAADAHLTELAGRIPVSTAAEFIAALHREGT